MKFKILAIAIASATAFVCQSSTSEAFHRLARARHTANHRACDPAPVCCSHNHRVVSSYGVSSMNGSCCGSQNQAVYGQGYGVTSGVTYGNGSVVAGQIHYGYGNVGVYSGYPVVTQ